MENREFMCRVCRSFDMWNDSIFMCFGITPKIRFTCWNCGCTSSGRIKIGDSYILRCKYCDSLNRIPIRID